ncbi:glutathione-dependent formaldehyde dehydrogenase [Paenibacillus sambharensis]|uniref:Glutathione-dependent formaldehyde dehydrogenase n=1 Tax=Paenibacillus sambharensis TaxID=1803190 RepID=A0A2W1LBT5_9BACL|nr:zinc-dependent alcohol dehydrogenase [Paenibacillus sambharensis]PZD96363.1 glutathione-dependent formaldehyde dehydrogenase [Paenibacillus sambharensis]
MKAVTYQGIKQIKVEDVPSPSIIQPDDLIVRVTSSAVCGSDLHLYHGMIPGLSKGYVIGHEPMGIVEETGPAVTKVKKGDRVVIPFNVACGQCFYCKHELESQCDNANPNGETGGYLGYSDMFGGYPGGQAQYLRVPFGNFAPFKVPEDCEAEDEKLVFLSDIMPTAYWGVERAGVKNGDTVIVLGCGPVGLLVQKFAWIKGAKRVIAVDNVSYRLEHARRTNNVEIINFEAERNIGETLKEMTHGGADVVIDCVGMDGKKTALEVVETALMLQGGTLGPFRIASQCVRKGGVIHLIGVYGLVYNAFPLGELYARNITLHMGQAPVIHYMPKLYQMVQDNLFDPTDIITHRVPIEEAPSAYKHFDQKTEGCIKVILKP